MVKSLLHNAKSDTEVAKMFNIMRFAMDKDPSLANCYSMGDNGFRWGSPLAWVARADCLPAVVCLLDRRDGPTKKLKNGGLAYMVANHKGGCNKLLLALMIEDTIPQEFIATAAGQQEVRYGDMWGAPIHKSQIKKANPDDWPPQVYDPDSNWWHHPSFGWEKRTDEETERDTAVSIDRTNVRQQRRRFLHAIYKHMDENVGETVFDVEKYVMYCVSSRAGMEWVLKSR